VQRRKLLFWVVLALVLGLALIVDAVVRRAMREWPRFRRP
jgi:hypothetical protein